MTVLRQDVPPEPESQKSAPSHLRHFISLLTAFPRQKLSCARDYRLMKRIMVDAVLEMSEYNRFSKGISAGSDSVQNGWNSKTWSVRQEKQNGLFGNYFLIRWKELPDFQ